MNRPRLPASPPTSRLSTWPSWSLLRTLLLVLMAASAITTPGCSCREETPAERAAREKREEEEAAKKKEEAEKNKKKPPLDIQPPIPQPGPEEITSLVVKPGHWMTAKQTLKPNYDDWVGQATLQVVDENRQPIPIDRTAFALRSNRDVALSKGQAKDIETVVFIPPVGGDLQWRFALRERGVALVDPPSHPSLKRMAPHQQHFVVLGEESQRYQFLDSLLSLDAPYSSTFERSFSSGEYDFSRQYRLVAPLIDDRIPLPESPLHWTSVAYLLWDEVNPERLSKPQQAALVDWLHWGGQLIISGPDSLDQLDGSFLDPYLPAESGGARTITADDLKQLSETWDASRRGDRLTVVGQWSGVRLNPRPEADPSAGIKELFAERTVGRGRVIVSAMRLTERDLTTWRGGFENLFNNVVLRRPPRRFAWDAGFNGEGFVYVSRDSESGAFVDASANSRLRLFSRDTYAAPNALSYTVTNPETTNPQFGGQFRNDGFESRKLVQPAASGGPGGWSDFNAAASAARESLREAAGVNVPDSSFVMACLAIYLAVLAPFNWFFFRALDRTELAWVAAPVIAIVGTWIVVKQAQLDIGFVRAQTEIAVLETQPNYGRGHLTRYLSFYTSLSTTYDLEFDDATTVAAPFARSSQSSLGTNQQPSIITFELQEKARLKGLAVSSNSTDMAHAEQMIDLGGVFRYDPQRRRLMNETDHRIRSLAVVYRPEDGSETLRGAWIGELDSRSSTPVSLLPITLSDDEAAFADRRSPEPAPGETNRSATSKADNLNLEPLYALALDPNRLAPGEVRAVGHIEEVFDGVTATPAASQLRGATFVVAHLHYAPLPAPKSDANAPMDVTPRR